MSDAYVSERYGLEITCTPNKVFYVDLPGCKWDKNKECSNLMGTYKLYIKDKNIHTIYPYPVYGRVFKYKFSGTYQNICECYTLKMSEGEFNVWLDCSVPSSECSLIRRWLSNIDVWETEDGTLKIDDETFIVSSIDYDTGTISTSRVHILSDKEYWMTKGECPKCRDGSVPEYEAGGFCCRKCGWHQ